ncbi:MAG: lactoylglutathione lyase [Deltaproteobacteria bacterium]|nr:MAG: lactoylglutathione lyase [Deltaproteobacteria bacterium]
MRFLHTMLRVRDLDAALHFWCTQLGLVETRRHEVPQGNFTLVFLATAPGEPEIELTHNWGQEEPYSVGRAFGHIALEVEDIHATCAALMESGVTILRPPRDGRMAFIRSPDRQSVELLQKGEALTPCEPWVSMPNTGEW